MDRENALLASVATMASGVLILMLLLGSGMITAGYFVRIDEVVTTTGQLKSGDGRNDIKTPANGKISKVHVTNGQRVEKGDLLIEFDTTLAQEKNQVEQLIELETIGLVKN